MNILTPAEYEKRKINFLHGHNDWTVETSPMTSDGEYRKIYKCSDGEAWFEVIRPYWHEEVIVVRKALVKVKVKLQEIEGFPSAGNADSIYCYEAY